MGKISEDSMSQSRYAMDIIEIKQKLEKLENVLYGDGSVGLVGKVASIEEKLGVLNKLLWTIVTTILSAVVLNILYIIATSWR